MTQRGTQVDLYDLLSGHEPSNPDMGGTTGGERERRSKSAHSQPWNEHIVVALHHYPKGVEAEAPDTFWGYWLNDEVVDQTPEASDGKSEGIQGLDSDVGRGASPRRGQRPHRRQRRKHATT